MHARSVTASEQIESASKEPKSTSIEDKSHVLARLILCLTVTYIAVELAFNARLLDVVGLTPDEHSIDAIETYGRLLSGLAMSLAVFPLVIKISKRYSRYFGVLGRSILAGVSGIALILMLPVSIACVAFANFLQEEIVTQIEIASSASTRRTANLLLLINDGLKDGVVEFDGLHLTESTLDRAETKAFLALLPAMNVSIDGIFDKLSPSTRAVITSKVVSDLEISELYSDYQTLSEQARQQYEGYWGLNERAGSFNDKVEQATAQVVNEMRWFLSEAGVRAGECDVSPVYVRAARNMLAAKHQVTLPASWQVCDVAGIQSVVHNNFLEQFETEIENEMIAKLGFSLPLGLSEQAFLASHEVTSAAGKEMGLSDTSDEFRFGYSSEEFSQAIVEPLVEKKIGESVKQYLTGAGSFEDGGQNDDVGYSAIRLTYVPLVAFMFSLAGIWLHIVKACYYSTISIKLPRVYAFSAAILALVCLVSAFPVWNRANHIRDSEYYLSLQAEGKMEDNASFVARIADVVIQWQPLLYPVGESIRSNDLFELEFGIHKEI